MKTVAAVGRVLRDLVLLTLVEPVRSGRPRTAGWPAGLRPLLVLTLLVYAALTLAVIFAEPLRTSGTLLVLSRGGLIPESGAVLLIGAAAFALALLQTAALHLAWWAKLLTWLLVSSVVLYFALPASLDPLSLLWSLSGLFVLLVMILLRWRARFAWWEFVVVAAATGLALFGSTAGSVTVSGMNADLRGTALEGALQSMASLAMPALFVAGAALAQIAVTASFAGVSSSVRELPRPLLRVLAWLLPLGALIVLGLTLADPENSAAGWSGSVVALLAIGGFAAVATRVAGRPPAWSDLDEDSTKVNYLVAVCAVSLALIAPTVFPLRALAGVLDIGWLLWITDWYAFITRQDATTSVLRMLAGGIGFIVALRTARRGRPWPAMFLAAVFVLATLTLLRTIPGVSIAVSVEQLSAVLITVLLVVGGVLLLGGRLSRQGAVALACGLVLCLVYPHRAILDDPISALLGFTGMGAVLFGLVWRVLTEGEITRDDTPRWPMPARVLLYCASALLAVTSAAYVALTRISGGDNDIAIYADAGDSLLGTPLFLTAVLGCLGIALAPARPAGATPDPYAGHATPGSFGR